MLRALVFTLFLAAIPAHGGLLPKINCKKAFAAIAEKGQRAGYKVTAATKGLLHSTRRFFSWLTRPPAKPGNQPAPQGTYPRGERSLQAHNKNTERTGPPGELVEAASIDVAHILYWKQTHFVAVDPITATATVPKGHRPVPTEEREPDEFLTITPNGTLPDYLLQPQGFRPFHREKDLEHFVIHEDPVGNLIVKAHSDEPIRIPLAKDSPTPLTDKERAQYTKVRKVPREMWPKWLQDEINQIHRKRSVGWSDTRVVEYITRLLNRNENLLYRVDEDPSFGVVDLMKRGGCQCDGAAATAVVLLRGEFNIPSRVVRGFTGARKTGDSSPRTVVAHPTDGHAWIEAFPRDQDRWVLADPTPMKMDREKNEELEDTGYEHLGREDGEDQENPNGPPNKDDKGDDGDETKGEDEAEDGDSHKSSNPLPKDLPLQPNPREEENFAFTHAQWIHALEALDNSSTLRKRLEAFVERNKENELDKSLPPYIKAAENLLGHLNAIRRNFDSAHDLDPNDRQDRPGFRVLQRALEELSVSRNLTDKEHRTLMTLRAQFPASKREGKPDTVVLGYSVFREFEDTVIENVIRSMYGNGEQIDFRAFGHALESGRANPFLHLLRVGHYLDTDFLKIPDWTTKTLFGAPQPVPHPADSIGITLAESIEDLPHLTNLGQPFSTLSFQLFSGTAFKRSHMTPKPREQRLIDERFVKNWVIVSDHSGSMSSDPRAKIRDALTHAAIERAYANDPENTRLSHISYGKRPKRVVSISSPEEASRFLHKKMRRSPDVWNDGNNTALALAKGFEIARENSERDKELNILLLTDGEEQILMDRIKKERKKLDPNIKVYLNVIALVSGNSDLQNLALGNTDIDVSGRYSLLSKKDVYDLSNKQKGLDFVSEFAVPRDRKKVTPPRNMKETLRGLTQSLFATQRERESIPRHFTLISENPLPTHEQERIYRIYLETRASMKGLTLQEIRADIQGEYP